MNSKSAKVMMEELFISSHRNMSNNNVGVNSEDDMTQYVNQLLRSPSRKSSELLNAIYEDSNQEFISQEYKDLMKDPLLKSALQLYADDVSNITSIDDIIIKCSNTEISSMIKDYLLNDVKISSEKLWLWAFNLVVFGDIYIERFHSEDGELLPGVMMHQHPEYITDIRSGDESIVFIEKVVDDMDSEYITDSGSIYSMVQGMENVTYDNRSVLHDKFKYVHGSLRGVFNNRRIKLEESIINEKTGEVVEGTTMMRTYEIYKGESLLENIKFIYRIIRLIEDALLMSRLQNSQRIDIINVDLGDRIDDKTTPAVVASKYKEAIKKQLSLNYDSSSLIYGASNYNGASKTNRAASLSNMIVNPVYKGRGSLAHEQIDGTLDISGIADLDYFNNKLFAGLRIPKPMLGWEESLGSSLGSGKMEELDKRYSRSVVRVTSVVEEVLTQLGRLYLEELGHDSDEYDLSVSIRNKSKDLTEKFEQIESTLDTIQPVIDVMQDYILNPEISLDSRRIYLVLYKNIIDPDIYNQVNELLNSSKTPTLLDTSIIQDITEIINDTESSKELKLLNIEGLKPMMSEGYYNKVLSYIRNMEDQSDEDEEV